MQLASTYPDGAIRTAAKPRTGKVPKPPPLTSTQDVTRAPPPAPSRMPPPPPPPLPSASRSPPSDAHPAHPSEPSDHSRSPRPCKPPPQSGGLPHIVVGKPAAKTVMTALATTRTKAAKPNRNQEKAAAAAKAGPVPMSTSSSTPTPSLLDQTLDYDNDYGDYGVVSQPRPLPLNKVRKILDVDSEEVECNRICVDPFATLTAWLSDHCFFYSSIIELY